MLNIPYPEIAKIFGKYTEGYNTGFLANLIIKYVLRRERPIDIFFKRIADGLKYEPQPYEYYGESFNYRACSWIFTIAGANLPEGKKVEIIRKAADKLIHDVFKRNEVYVLLPISDKGIERKNANQSDYFSAERIDAIRHLEQKKFDTAKLVRILEEINHSYKGEAYLAVSCLLRMFIDHIAPIFGNQSFKEVVNNHPFSRSDKKNLEHLLGGLKNISDGNLHSTIGSEEVLPTEQTVEFRADFDVLLRNIIQALSNKG